MFKIVSAEIKKIVSKPGIYVLSVLLAIILILGVFIYKPTVQESIKFELTGDTYVEKYTDFTQGDLAGKKAESKTKIDNAIQSIINYSITVSPETYTQKEYIDFLVNKTNEVYNSYKETAYDNSTNAHVISIRAQMVSSLENLNSAIETALTNSQYGSFSLLTTKENYENYKSSYKQVLDWSRISVNKDNLDIMKAHFVQFENKYKENFYNSINGFKYPELSKEFVKTYSSLENGTKYATLNSRLDEILLEIKTNFDLALNDSKLNINSASKMDELANLYVETVNTYVNLIKYELLSNAFSIVSTNEELKMLHLSDYSSYNSNSLLERYSYLFENNKTEYDYARPLTIGVTSNDEINAYDYSYFVLKIFSFVIIIYAIMSACHSIAGEIKEGSMRYLAIRPVSRTNMFFGKWFAIIIMSIILMLFSFVISLCVGGAVYGFSSNTILTIFNGHHAFTIHPLGMIGIYLGSMLLELIIYSLIAMLLSVLFKSDLMSMTILLVIYLLNTLLPIFVQGTNTWLAYYPFSHISLYSLFGSSVYSVSNNFFNLVFGAKIYAGTHIALTISIIVLICAVVSAVAIKVFKKKEL